MNLLRLLKRLSDSGPAAFKRLVSDPFFHFVAVGFAVFILYGALNPTAKELHISEDLVAGIIQDYKTKYNRTPGDEEVKALVAAYIEDELLYREAVKNGLADGDMIIRRRLIQKAHFALAGNADTDPDDAELTTHLKKYAHRFTVAANISFEHIFFRKSSLAHTTKIARGLRDGSLTFAAALPYGDGFILGPKINGMDFRRLVDSFGLDFAKQVVTQKANGDWLGPLSSTYGFHLVRVTGRKNGQVPPLAKIRNQVREDYIKTAKEQNKRQMIKDVIAGYEVKIDYPAQAVGWSTRP